jgi:nuclear transport factor 2 (NTF2) superfamily protein
MEELKLPLPPFNMETAKQKIQLAEDAWNSKDPGSGFEGLHHQ